MKYLIWIGASFLISMIGGIIIQALSLAAIDLFAKNNKEEKEENTFWFAFWGIIITFVASLIVGARFVLSPEQIEKVIYVGSMIIGGAAILLILNILGRIFEVAFSIIKILIKIAIVIFIIAFLASLMFGI